MHRNHSRALASALALSLCCLAPAPAQDPPAGGVFVGAPGATPRKERPYLAGRVRVQITEQALQGATVDRSWRNHVPAASPTTGLPALDLLLAEAGVTGHTRAYIDVDDAALARELGLDRWWLFFVDESVDVPELARRLRALPEVENAEPDWRAHPLTVPNDPLYPKQWGHHNTGQMLDYCWGCGGHPNGSPVGTPGFDADAETAWNAPQGFGSPSIVIAIVDTGVDTSHPDLRLVAGWDYGDDDSDPNDDSASPGHGTATAGVAAAIADNGIGVAGIAGGCSVMPLKVADSAGNMGFTAVANAILHAANNGAHVVSMSLGASITDDAGTSSAIDFAYGQGLVLLAATANSNKSTIDYPARHAKVIAVGAASPCGERKRSSSNPSDVNPGVSTDPNGTTCDGERWWGSNYGSAVQDAADAVDVIAPTILPTTDIRGAGGFDPGDYSLWFNGTSCATPYAAGVCALILSANPTFTPDQVRQRLVSTATDVVSVESGPGWDRYTGYGMVDAAAAVAGGGGGGSQPYAALPYATGFESGALDAFWTVVEGSQGRIQVTTANGPFAGGWHLTMDDAVSGSPFSLNQALLHLDLSGETQVELSFRWKEFGDETHSQDGIYFSDDGGQTFVKVHDLKGQSTPNDTWQLVSLDLDQLAGANGLTLSSTFVVKFQQYDNYPIPTDGFAFDEIRVEAPSGGGGGGGRATLPYATGFESGALDPFWTTVPGTEGRISVTTANGPAVGSWHLTMDDSVNGSSFSLNQALLRLDLTGETQVRLSFDWKEFGDETHSQDGVYFSDDDGATFVKVFDLAGQSTPNDTWQSFSLDLDQLAVQAGLSLNSSFVVKFQQYDNYGIPTDGFAFDEVRVEPDTGGGGQGATPPYFTGFESGFDGFWTTFPGTEGRIQVTTQHGPFAGARHLTMDDAVSGGAFSRNEAWLHLNLAGRTQVRLTFHWKDFSDETHSQDGVYFSDDGGATFVKVHSLQGGSTPNNTWQTVVLDVDQLAASVGLALTADFVVKFQQYDNYPITIDGMAFDDILVE